MASRTKIRYAVTGLGWISQVAVLPSFRNANENSELAALISEDPEKRDALSKKYGIGRTYSYEQYDECLNSGEIDAVYIALPNNLHRDYTVRAARAGMHVLCEKPMAVTEQECEDMIRACEDNRVKLMIAYRLHFEEANLKAIQVAQSGKIGEPRYFSSVFSQQVPGGNIRVRRETGGGTLYDIGVYCINAARYIFQDDPVEAAALTANNGEPRFREIEEMTAATLRFPGQRLAQFTCSFGAAPVSSYRIVGTRGDLAVSPAYTFGEPIRHELTVDGKTGSETFGTRDQFGPELTYFSNCIMKGREPEPSGLEGLADVRIVRALYASADKGGVPVKLDPFPRKRRPSMEQEIHEPPVKEPGLINAEDPTQAA